MQNAVIASECFIKKSFPMSSKEPQKTKKAPEKSEAF